MNTTNDELLPLWRAQVQRQPEETAVSDDGKAWSYRQLDQWSDALAATLHEVGIPRGAVVALCGERGAAAVASQLAVLKLGACYFPLDPQLPAARRDYLLNDAAPAVMLYWGEEASSIAAEFTTQRALPVFAVEAFASTALAGRRGHAFAAPPALAGQALYLLYTSGSSGQPKGVLGTRLGLMNRLRWQWRTCPFTADERVAQRTHLGFVDAVAETWGALLGGVPLVIIPAAVVADVDCFIATIAEQRITRLLLVPSLLQTLLAAVPNLGLCWPRLRWCVCSGEVLTPLLARAFQRAVPHCRLLNLYGMTEAAADLSAALVCGNESLQQRLPVRQVTLGRPLPGLHVCVLDEQGREAAPGQVGEIYVGGAALAHGYHRRAGRTAACFLPDPRPAYPGARLYATGDLGCFNQAGELEYHGRRDDQVKIRGHRVSLLAVERQAEQHPAVARCAALLIPAPAPNATPTPPPAAAIDAAVTDAAANHVAGTARTAANETVGGGAGGWAGDAHLVLFIALAPGGDLTSAGLRAFLRQRLADYMMPALIDIRLRLPQLANGKIDRQALRASRLACLTETTAGPRAVTGAQRQVAMVWQEILRCAPPAGDSRFLHLGGNSLTAALVVSRLRASFNVPLSMTEFFACATLAELARLLHQRQQLQRSALAAPGSAVGPGAGLFPIGATERAINEPDDTVDVVEF